MKNLKNILNDLLIEKKLSHTPAFRKNALMSLNENNPYDLFKKLYNNNDVECAKMLVKIFPGLFYDGEFRKDTRADKQAKNEKEVKYLNKSFLSFMKNTGVLDNENELNHILFYNKVITKNARAIFADNYILPFAEMPLSFNIDFSVMCFEISGELLPPRYLRMLMSSMDFNAKKDNSWKSVEKMLMSVISNDSDIFNDFYRGKYPSNYNYSHTKFNNIDNISFFLEKRHISESSIPAIKRLFTERYSEISSIFSMSLSVISVTSLENKMNFVENLLTCGFDKKKIFELIPIINLSDNTKKEHIEKLMEYGFDLNSSMQNPLDGRYRFWFEKLIITLSESEYTDSMQTMQYAIKNGLDILSSSEELNGLSKIDYIMDNPANAYYRKKNEKEIGEILNYARVTLVEKEKAIIKENLAENSNHIESVKRRM